MKDIIENKAKKLINYKEPRTPIKRCNNCAHSYCWNPGAIITSLNCKIIEKKMKELDKESYAVHNINEEYGFCDCYARRKSNNR